MKNDKASLVEATMLALQGKLILEENKTTKKLNKSSKKKAESINVSLQDDGSTVVDTDEATVIVQEREVVPEITPTETAPVVTEIPVEVEETSVEEVPTIDEIVDEEPIIAEEPLEEISTEETEVVEDELEESNILGNETEEEKIAKEDAKSKGLYSEAKEVKTEDMTIDYSEALKKIYQSYVDMGMEDSFFEDLVNTTSITPEEIERWYQQSELDESKKIENKEVKTESLKEDLQGLTSGLYDYIANNYYKLTTEELKELALNAVYVADDDKQIIAEIMDRLIEGKENCKDCDKENCDCKKESKQKFNSKSFETVVENYYKENYKTIKGFKISKVLKNESKLKIEGVLTNKFDKTRNICLEANLTQKGKSFNKYTITEASNIMLENKNDIKMSLMTFTNKDNILECKYLKNVKKLTK